MHMCSRALCTRSCLRIRLPDESTEQTWCITDFDETQPNYIVCGSMSDLDVVLPLSLCNFNSRTQFSGKLFLSHQLANQWSATIIFSFFIFYSFFFVCLCIAELSLNILSLLLLLLLLTPLLFRSPHLSLCVLSNSLFTASNQKKKNSFQLATGSNSLFRINEWSSN